MREKERKVEGERKVKKEEKVRERGMEGVKN